MKYFGCFFLDNEKDMIVNLYKEKDRLYYELETPNHHSGNLIRNFANVCRLPLSVNEKGLQVIRDEVPSYIDGENREVYILRFGDTKTANIFPDGRIEQKASVPAITKTLMSQTKDYRLDERKTIFKTYIKRDYKFRSDLHTHMNGNLSPDILIALGIKHQIRYPLYYVRKLGLVLNERQEKEISRKREKVARQFEDSGLAGKYLDRKINDNTYINFADLILGNMEHAEENIVKIRISLTVLKDGQAVFTNLEKVYLYRYVFCKGKADADKVELAHIDEIPDKDVKKALLQMLEDEKNPNYWGNSIFQDKLLWIARQYQRQGINYVEISDTTLVKKYESLHMLTEVHEVMPQIYRETGVMIRFLAALRRIPLTIVKDAVTPEDYLQQNLQVLRSVVLDPYVAGSDFVGEEINDISELKPMIEEIVKIAKDDPDYVIRIHAGENDNLRDNVAKCIELVQNALAPGQPMPKMRLGHGLYTCSLKSKKGKALLENMKKTGVILEFQLTSNVRLNNLNSLENHPLHEYLKAGVACVQGTDGAALYGSNSMDEQLSLEKLLDMTREELISMYETEQKVIAYSMEAFKRKSFAFRELLQGRTLTEYLLARMEQDTTKSEYVPVKRRGKMDATTELEAKIQDLTWEGMPVILSGGSFNTANRVTKMSEEGTKQIDQLMEVLSPEEAFFVIGYKMTGYEKYLLEHNEKGFRIYSFVPAKITTKERSKILAEDVAVRISTESEGMGIYKSFNYEIFERRPSLLVLMDGNSLAENLIQEAKNGKGKSAIFVWDKATTLKKKADSLEGYIHYFGDRDKLDDQIIRMKDQLFAPRGVDTKDWYQTHREGK